MEEDIEHLKDLKVELDNMSITGPTSEDRLNTHRKSLAILNILNELDKLQKKNKKLISDNLEYQRIQDIFDKRTYRKKYLEERRKEEPNLLYPDADEIYQRYYELKKENEGLKETRIDQKEYGSMKIRLANSIPKSIIQDKIEKLKENISTAQGEELLIFDSKLDVLKELLNKGE